MTAREILVKQLHRLMEAEGWRRPDGEWDIAKLHAKVQGSRRWLYRLVRGEVNFTIAEYDRILDRAFGIPFEFVMTGLKTSPLPRDVEDLTTDLHKAIANAKETGTFEGLRFALAALFDKTTRDKALHEKSRPVRSKAEAQQEGNITANVKKKGRVHIQG